MDDDIPYLLLTPGPLTTSRTVRQAMLRDYCTWDTDYNELVTGIRRDLASLAASRPDEFTTVLMQGSGTFAVESVLGTAIPGDGTLLVLENGAYGHRMVQIAERLKVACVTLRVDERQAIGVEKVRQALEAHPEVTHVAVVHCETTTGMLNPVAEIGRVVKEHGKIFVVDAMSSFGGIPLTMEEFSADFLISSANKCVQGTPGFGFVIARRSILEACEGRARSLSLDLYDQWREMEEKGGKWRFTSPTHVVRAFLQAMVELDEEGGVAARHARYRENQRRLVEGMELRGFPALLPRSLQSPIITAFHEPDRADYTFDAFYQNLKRQRFVIYPGKISSVETFRIGTIGHVFPSDIDLLLEAVSRACPWARVATGDDAG